MQFDSSTLLVICIFFNVMSQLSSSLQCSWHLPSRETKWYFIVARVQAAHFLNDEEKGKKINFNILHSHPELPFCFIGYQESTSCFTKARITRNNAVREAQIWPNSLSLLKHTCTWVKTLNFLSPVIFPWRGRFGVNSFLHKQDLSE